MSTTPRTDAALYPMTGGVDIVWPDFARQLETELARLRAEVERLKKQIKDDNRAYGCELRDPNGTIWEQAAKDYARAERAEAALTPLLTGRITHAGFCAIGIENLDGVFIAVDREQLKALPCLPMYSTIELREAKSCMSAALTKGGK